jgi:hypothetical protein
MVAIRSQTETEQRKDTLFDESLKRTGAGSHTQGVGVLTCTEAQVDAILSEGESI